MKNYWAKKDQKLDLQFGISNDHTRFESMRYTKLKEKLNELKDKGEDDWCIRFQLVKKKGLPDSCKNVNKLRRMRTLEVEKNVEKMLVLYIQMGQ